MKHKHCSFIAKNEYTSVSIVIITNIISDLFFF